MGHFSQNIRFLRLQLFFSFSTYPVNSVFSVVVRIYKILVIDEPFFSSLEPLPGKVKKRLFPGSFVSH